MPTLLRLKYENYNDDDGQPLPLRHGNSTHWSKEEERMWSNSCYSGALLDQHTKTASLRVSATVSLVFPMYT